MAHSGSPRFDALTFLCRVAAARGSTSPEQLAKLAERTEPEILAAVIANPETPVEVVQRLIDEADGTLTEIAFSEGSLPLHVALKFAEHPYWFVRAVAARSLVAPTALLTILAEDSDVEVKLEVAQNPTTPRTLLIDLALEATDVIRETVARNPNAPTEALRYLIADPEMRVRSAVARRSRLPADLLDVLSRDEHEYVRCALAANETLSELDLDRLWSDTSDRVRRIVACRRLESAEWVAKMPQETVLEATRAAAYQSGTIAEILKGLKFEVLDSDEQSPKITGEYLDEKTREKD